MKPGEGACVGAVLAGLRVSLRGFRAHAVGASGLSGRTHSSLGEPGRAPGKVRPARRERMPVGSRHPLGSRPLPRPLLYVTEGVPSRRRAVEWGRELGPWPGSGQDETPARGERAATPLGSAAPRLGQLVLGHLPRSDQSAKGLCDVALNGPASGAQEPRDDHPSGFLARAVRRAAEVVVEIAGGVVHRVVLQPPLGGLGCAGGVQQLGERARLSAGELRRDPGRR